MNGDVELGVCLSAVQLHVKCMYTLTYALSAACLPCCTLCFVCGYLCLHAEWPQGFKSHATVAVSIILCILLWLIAAGFILLLCCTFTATGIALAGDVAAKQALR